MKILLSTKTIFAIAFAMLMTLNQSAFAFANPAVQAAVQATQEIAKPPQPSEAPPAQEPATNQATTQQPVVETDAKPASPSLIARGVVFSDLDNDGYEDIYALSGFFTAPKEVAIARDI